MSQTLLLGLAASLPLCALAWLAGLAVEALGAGIRLRARLWLAAFYLPLALAPAMLIVDGLDLVSPFATATAPMADAAQSAVYQPTAGLSWQTAVLIGLVGIAALRLVALAQGLRRLGRLAAASTPAADPGLGPQVRLADAAAPVLAGLSRPVILLPRRLAAALSPAQAALVCAHEREHLAAGDHLSHLLEDVMIRIHWFNPALAAVHSRLAAAREEACDARVLATADAAGRRAYAESLLAALKLSGEAQPACAFTGLRRRGAARRLKSILNPAGRESRKAALAAGAAAGLLASLAGGLSLALAGEPQPAPAAPAPTSAQTPATPREAEAPAPKAAQRYSVQRVQPARSGTQAPAGDQFIVTPRPGSPDPVTIPLPADLQPTEAFRRRAEQALADGERSIALAQRRMTAPAGDGRVLMRCKLKADGTPDDCQRFGGFAIVNDGKGVGDQMLLLNCKDGEAGESDDCRRLKGFGMLLRPPPPPPAPPQAPPRAVPPPPVRG